MTLKTQVTPQDIHDIWTDISDIWTAISEIRTNLPTPPKKELTQRELDEEAHDVWSSGSGLANWNDPTGHIWHAALAYRDKQNAEDLGFVRDMCARIDADALDRLRRRSGLDT